MRNSLDHNVMVCGFFFQSLAERNRRLLKEKKVLLIQNKVEIERLEKEKVFYKYL